VPSGAPQSLPEARCVRERSPNLPLVSVRHEYLQLVQQPLLLGTFDPLPDLLAACGRLPRHPATRGTPRAPATTRRC